MTWLQDLDQVCASDLPQMGYKVYALGLLAKHRLPVVAGQVIPAQIWQSALSTLNTPDVRGWLDQPDRLEMASLQDLQMISQRAQRAFMAADLPPALLTPLLDWPHPAWILRASLGVSPTQQLHRSDLGLGLWPAQVGSPALVSLPKAIQQFWAEALSVRNLVVWRKQRRPLSQLPLATLLMTLHPTLVTGTLRLEAQRATWACVQGIGLPLVRGEAIPAQGQMDLAQPDTLRWQPGFQEQVYQVGLGLGDDPLQNRALPLEARQPKVATTPPRPLRITQRDDPTLSSPLTNDQIHQLIDLAQRSYQLLIADPWIADHIPAFDLGLEWILCPTDQGEQFLITQVIPYFRPPDPPSTPATTAPAIRQDRAPNRLHLPSVSTVVKGIGASAGQVQGIAVVATQPQQLPHPLPPNAIVVLPDLQPDVFLQLGAVVGIVTEQGGATCHAAILAREIGVPAIVGAPQATAILENATPLWLDGDRGVVYGLDAAQIPPIPAPMRPAAPHLAGKPPESYTNLRTKVMANLSQIRRLATLPVDHIAGVGLLRSEWLLLDILEGHHPWHWVNQGRGAELQSRIVQQLEPILQRLGPKPLRYRSLDLRSHEWQALEGSPPLEPNPMLGLRGTLSYDADARLFETELAALATLQRAGYTNLELILPFVRTVEEVLVCQQYIQQAGLKDCDQFALWIMAEVPSVLFLLPAYAQAGVQGIAIGSNDLTQLLLAVDRDQPILASAYDERHPVIQMAMAHLIQEAHRCGLTCSICGQAPVRHPELIANLVAWGIHSISVETAALPFTLESVWQAEQALINPP
ncbi:MAG: putative PEP-binding protein [Spirulina sp.]